MAIDEMTDEALFEAYQKNPDVKALVESIQREHGVHWDQRNDPGYDKKKVPFATKEAKKAVKNLLEGSEQYKKAPAYGGILSEKVSYAAGLAGIIGGVLALGAGAASFGLLGFLAAGAAAAYLYSNTPQQSYKAA